MLGGKNNCYNPILVSFVFVYIGIFLGWVRKVAIVVIIVFFGVDIFVICFFCWKSHFGTGRAGQALEPSEAQILVSHRTEMLCTLMMVMVMISLTVMMMMVMTPMMMQIMIDAMMMTTCAGGGPCGLKVCDTVA